MTIYFKKLNDRAVLPIRGSKEAAGLDLSYCGEEALTLLPGERKKVPTGLAVELPQGTAGMIYPRSGLSIKFGITCANCVGVVDSDYRGELMVPLINLSDAPYTILPGDRVAQLVVTPVLFPTVEEASDLSDTRRGENGFGSTGFRQKG